MNNRGEIYKPSQDKMVDQLKPSIKDTSTYIAIFTTIIIGLAAILAPIPTLLLYTLISATTKKNNSSKLFVCLGYFIAINSALAMSILLASRDYGTGQSVGFGSDMIHYADAFDYITSRQWSNWQELLAGAIFRTGGGEPLFWMTVSAISQISTDPKTIHIGISLIGFGLIFSGAEYHSRNGTIALSMYFSTITCYAFQGSALRSGLAFSMLIIAISFLLKRRNYTSSALALGASVTHFSMLPFFGSIAIINHLKLNAKNFGKFALISTTLIFIYAALLTFGSLEVLQDKIEARLEENTTDKTSEYQFLIELSAMTLLCYINRNSLSRNIKLLFALFAAMEVLFYLFFPSIFPRLYRYIYAVYLFIFLELIGSWRPVGRALLLCITISWGAFIVTTRYQDLFHGTNILEHFAAPWLK